MKKQIEKNINTNVFFYYLIKLEIPLEKKNTLDRIIGIRKSIKWLTQQNSIYFLILTRRGREKKNTIIFIEYLHLKEEKKLNFH